MPVKKSDQVFITRKAGPPVQGTRSLAKPFGKAAATGRSNPMMASPPIRRGPVVTAASKRPVRVVHDGRGKVVVLL